MESFLSQDVFYDTIERLDQQNRELREYLDYLNGFHSDRLMDIVDSLSGLGVDVSVLWRELVPLTLSEFLKGKK